MTALDAGKLFAEIINDALPIAIVFALGNKAVSTFLTAAFGGKMKL